ncbi:TPA: hypothetical protein ACWS6R_000090 [Klebsiella pneumoniae]|uniref:hypothetical protein n=1 Tax=Klebsiella sp. GG_Kp140 TaxID=3153451 RepID=UPI0032B5CB2A|nr:hypothetical protein [Klebsiella pneumoniae]
MNALSQYAIFVAIAFSSTIGLWFVSRWLHGKGYGPQLEKAAAFIEVTRPINLIARLYGVHRK